MNGTKRPVSVLVVIHSPDLHVLLLERATHPGYWQSVTGSQEGNESLAETACREVGEETGLVIAPADLLDWQLTHTFEIFAEWRHRYPAGTTRNTEHVFSLRIAQAQPVRLAPDEHIDQCWLPWQEAASRCFSWSNRSAIRMLPFRTDSNSPLR